eukprot:SAG31_NODE_45374_length_259_cov_0.643750_1_plen_65_part_01
MAFIIENLDSDLLPPNFHDAAYFRTIVPCNAAPFNHTTADLSIVAQVHDRASCDHNTAYWKFTGC